MPQEQSVVRWPIKPDGFFGALRGQLETPPGPSQSASDAVCNPDVSFSFVLLFKLTTLMPSHTRVLVNKVEFAEGKT